MHREANGRPQGYHLIYDRPSFCDSKASQLTQNPREARQPNIIHSLKSAIRPHRQTDESDSHLNFAPIVRLRNRILPQNSRRWLAKYPFAFLLLFLACSSWASELEFEGLRINQAQTIGTHNSYHIAPHPSLDRLIRETSNKAADSIAYTHRSLTEQFDRLGIRQIELDLFADSRGGRFAKPKGIELAKAAGYPDAPNFDPDGALEEPGIKILHSPDFDYLTNVLTFERALREIEAWSDANPDHFPITVLLELKTGRDRPDRTKTEPFDEDQLGEIDATIRKVMGKEDLITPADVRGPYATLREAVLERGWPSISSARGRVMFCMDNTSPVRDLYLSLDPNQESSVLFLSYDPASPVAGFFKMNNPKREFDEIQRRVKAGFIVRTRADSPTSTARENDPTQRDLALNSGAQFVSTDYPEPNLSFSLYQVQFPQGEIIRSNPVSGEPNFSGVDLERDWRRVDTETSQGLQRIAERARDAHSQRRLAEASNYYRALLEVEPARELTEAERARIIRLAPLALRVDQEPFELRDVVAIQHPSQPWIAYHLMWGDDIDYPEDNDPVDHEVVWVRYDEATGTAEELAVYFHGSILFQAVEDDRPSFGVEWGKHGLVTLPVELFEGGDELRANWRRLNREGTRRPNHPLARTWPKSYSKSYSEYTTFRSPLDLGERLTASDLMGCSRWGNAALDQRFLPYNFSAKPDWPKRFSD